MGSEDIFKSFPANFREKVIGFLLLKSIKGESVQLVGLHGSGKSLLFRALISSCFKEILEYHLKAKFNNLEIYYVDFGLVINQKPAPALKLILLALDGSEKENTEEDIPLKLEEKIKKLVVDKGKRLVFVFDSFDEFLSNGSVPFFKALQAVTNKYRDALSFIFLVNKEIENGREVAAVGGIGRRLLENIYYLPNLDKKDTNWFISSLEKQLEISLPDKTKTEIFNLTGGYTSTVKRLVELVAAGSSLEELAARPQNYQLIKQHFELLLDNLKEEKDALIALAQGKKVQPEEKIEKLRRLYLTDKDNQFTNKLFETYIKSQYINILDKPAVPLDFENCLTRNEHGAYVYLYQNKDKFCSKDDLIEAVWGERATVGIASHAADQLIHRLRAKMLKKGKNATIETVHGRGYLLKTT